MEDRPFSEASEVPEASALEDMEVHETSQPQVLAGLQIRHPRTANNQSDQ